MRTRRRNLERGAGNGDESRHLRQIASRRLRLDRNDFASLVKGTKEVAALIAKLTGHERGALMRLVRAAGIEPAQAFRPYGFSHQPRLSPPRLRIGTASSWSGLSLRPSVRR